MSDAPVLLLDVDGVINAHGPYADIYKKGKRRYNPHWDCRMSEGLARTGSRDWTIWWAQPMADRLLALHRDGAVEIRWCSTWNSDVTAIENLLGWPVLTVAFATAGVHHRDIPRLKRQAAQRVLEVEQRRLVWADDSEVPFSWELSHAAMTEDGRALLIRPRETRGLMPEHLDQIEQFCGLSTDGQEETA